MKIFQELGEKIDARWRKQNYCEQIFPEIASEALEHANLIGNVTPSEILRWSHLESELPRQQDIDAHFGNPPLTLFCGERFYIDIYFWLDGTTEIHQHAFAGAFQVFDGSSIHSKYRFQQATTINEHLLLGDIIFVNSELLKVGDVRKIIPGKEHIHALFHLDRPSATITIRTFGLPSAQPQFSYRKPCVAVDPFYKEPALIKKIQTAGMLLSLPEVDGDDILSALIKNADLHSAFLLLQISFARLADTDLEKQLGVFTNRARLARVIDAARTAHGSVIDQFLLALYEQQRVEEIVRLRSYLKTNEHRFFLALLLNLPDRKKLLELVGDRFPDQDAVDTVLDWVMELSSVRVWGSEKANILGIPSFDHDYLFVFECLLREFTDSQIREAIRAQYPVDYQAKLEGRRLEIASELQNCILFRSILS